MLTSLEKKVLFLVEKIPLGKITTYKEIAKALNLEKGSRFVGNSLRKNPEPIKIPCHRVIKSNGFLGGYFWGKNKKIELLKKEGVIVKNNKIFNYKNIIFKF